MAYRIALTPGEPAGIGPDLCIQLAQQPPANIELVVIADPALLQQRADALKLPLSLKPFLAASTPTASKPGELSILEVELASPVQAGSLNPANAQYVLATLSAAADAALKHQVDAIVTGPVQKSIINEAGIPFTGHTEFFADFCKVKLTVMMLATEGLRVALVTTHLPLAEISKAITRDLLNDVVEILHADLRNKFGISDPEILVCGLNPHAGEDGHLGREEIDIIEPLLRSKRAQGMKLIGPLPADTLFTEKYLASADAVLSMYHDQGLPVLKYKGFGNASNITLGLPIIRTSVDHGTALDLAATGQASTGSLSRAITDAVLMANNFRGSSDKGSSQRGPS